MEELKFRVWDGGNMEYNVTVGIFGAFYVNPMKNGDGLDEDDTASLTPFNTLYPKECPIMQYIGLKDKNDKEIYEGDIVRVRRWWWKNGDVLLANGEQVFGEEENGQVIYYHPTAQYLIKFKRYDDEWDFGHYSSSEMEVIGNIHEGIQ